MAWKWIKINSTWPKISFTWLKMGWNWMEKGLEMAAKGCSIVWGQEQAAAACKEWCRSREAVTIARSFGALLSIWMSKPNDPRCALKGHLQLS